jgi:hypothetical protein
LGRAGQSRAPLSCAAQGRHASRGASARTLGRNMSACPTGTPSSSCHGRQPVGGVGTRGSCSQPHRAPVAARRCVPLAMRMASAWQPCVTGSSSQPGGHSSVLTSQLRPPLRPNPLLERDPPRLGTLPASRARAILRLAGKAPILCGPLSANVRPGLRGVSHFGCTARP